MSFRWISVRGLSRGFSGVRWVLRWLQKALQALELKRLANKAMMGIIDTTKDGLANSLDGQLGTAAAGVSKVQNWMQQMVGEMKNLSVAQSFGSSEVPATSVPMFDISSIPTTAEMTLSAFDPTSSSTLHGAPDRSAVAPIQQQFHQFNSVRQHSSSHILVMQ